MARRNRATLRNYFKAGELPREDHFADLIDSTLNIVDEGFNKTPESGVQISTLGSNNALLSFYTHDKPNAVSWSISYGVADKGEGAGQRLVFVGPACAPGEYMMALQPAPAGVRVSERAADQGTAKDRSPYMLDVKGVLRATGRIGGYEAQVKDTPPANETAQPAGKATAGAEATKGSTKSPKPSDEGSKPSDKASEKSPVLADGEWHYITDPLEGCQGFEVMAGVGGAPRSGRYALLHAIALSTFNPARGWFSFLRRDRKKIRTTEAYFSGRCDRLELRWLGTSGDGALYRLAVRSRCHYGSGVKIQFHITQLWFDAHMRGDAERKA